MNCFGTVIGLLVFGSLYYIATREMSRPKTTHVKVKESFTFNRITSRFATTHDHLIKYPTHFSIN